MKLVCVCMCLCVWVWMCGCMERLLILGVNVWIGDLCCRGGGGLDVVGSRVKWVGEWVVGEG